MQTIASIVVIMALLSGCNRNTDSAPYTNHSAADAKFEAQKRATDNAQKLLDEAISESVRQKALLTPTTTVIAPTPLNTLITPAYTKYDLQSCLNHEFANILMTENLNISDEKAFEKGYSKGYDFADRYKEAFMVLPNPEVDAREIITTAQEVGMRMFKYLTLNQISKDLEKCRNTFR